MINSIVKQIAKSQPTEVLKDRNDEIQQKILNKQKLIGRLRGRTSQLEKNCSYLKEEYKIIDRVIFLRENSITKLSTESKKEKKQEASIKQRVEDMSAAEASELLSQLLAIQKRRQR